MKIHFKIAHKLVLLIMAMCLLPLFSGAQWSVPVNISANSRNAAMNENMGPCLAANGDTLHVVWSDITTQGSAIYYTRSVDTGHTWSAPVSITDTNGKAYHPAIAVNGSNIHVVWWDSLNEVTNFANTGNSSMYKHSLDGGNTWSARVVIDSNTVYWPGVAVAGSTVLISLDKGIFDSTIIWLTKSLDDGLNFGPQQRISTRTGRGRSEDQGMATDGHYIHICWNDERPPSTSQRILKTYYRRSQDMGLTWDPEIVLTDTTAYSPMVFIDSNKIEVAIGYSGNNNAGFLNSWIGQSMDSGSKWAAVQQVTTNTASGEAEAYPFMVCDASSLYMVSHTFGVNPWRVFFTQSADGGATWSSQIALGTTDGTAFIALSCPALHVVWPDSGKIYYTRNPTGNAKCTASIPDTTTGIISTQPLNTSVSICPNPANGNIIVSYGHQATDVGFTLTDMAGRNVLDATLNNASGKQNINAEALLNGVYFWEAKAGASLLGKGKIVLINK